jgi:hypothetical protein
MIVGVATRAACVVLALIALGARSDAQVRDPAGATAAATRRIIGVYDSRTGDPLLGVQVRDALSGTFAVTTATGTAPLAFLSYRGTAGLIVLRKLGFRAKSIVVSRADTVSITALLEPLAELAPVVTTARYRLDRDAGRWDGFDARCRTRSVTCYRSDELEKRPTVGLADVLVRAEGFTIGACGGGRDRQVECGRIAMRPTVTPPSFCQPTFFVDGFEWNAKLGSPIDLTPGKPPESAYAPTNVKGVEVYPPGKPRPLRFEGDPLCGAVVIWTK